MAEVDFLITSQDVSAKHFYQTFWSKKSTGTFDNRDIDNWDIYPDFILIFSVLPNAPETFWARVSHFLHIWETGMLGILKHLANNVLGRF